MDEREYEKYISSLITWKYKCSLLFKKNRKHILQQLIIFHQSCTFGNVENYAILLKQDYENYLSVDWFNYFSAFVKYNKEHPIQIFQLRKNGQYYKTDYYLKALKFENYLCFSKHVKPQFRYYISASNKGIFGKLPIPKEDERKVINEVLRLLLHHYMDYCGSANIQYNNSPFYNISHSEMTKIYEEKLKNVI